MLKIGHPMEWLKHRDMALIRGETKRWWGLEERMDARIKQPWLWRICYLSCYFLLELPLFMVCMMGELILHPWDSFMELYDTWKMIRKWRKEEKEAQRK